MPIYRVDNEKIIPIDQTTFQQQGLRERHDLQPLLKSQIEVISPDTLVVAEEFGDWEDSRRRIDLLGIDKDANLVVIELKRTEDGGHMELQAVRYAAMISTLTFNKLVAIHQHYLTENGIDEDATKRLLNFLEWSEPDEEQFGQEVRIVLASADFSKELTTSVMWLNDFGLDIRCVRMRPYLSDGQTLLDIQTVIPIPEVADYQIQIREKKQRERESRKSNRDFTKYDVQIADRHISAQSKRGVAFHLVSGILANDGTPEQILEALHWRKGRTFRILDGELTAEDAYQEVMKDDRGGRSPLGGRYFCEDDKVFHIRGKTYLLSNQWGPDIEEAARRLAEEFPDLKIEIKRREAG